MARVGEREQAAKRVAGGERGAILYLFLFSFHLVNQFKKGQKIPLTSHLKL